MGRYNFSPDEQQKRAQASFELKKKFDTQRAVSASAGGGKKGKGDDEKKKAVATVPKIDIAAYRTERRDRRNFILGTLTFSGALGLSLAGSGRFMYPRVLFEPPSSFVAGPIGDFLPDVPTFFTEFRTWIIVTGGRLYALTGRCTHLGCTPSWLASDTKFKCPCHGSGFRISGINFEGPAPRALERFQVSLEGGNVVVEKAKVFFYENGDWDNPESFINV